MRMSEEQIGDNCMVCGVNVPDYVPEYCCGGHECNCRAMPIEPPICSDVCWEKLMNPEVDRKDFYYFKQQADKQSEAAK